MKPYGLALAFIMALVSAPGLVAAEGSQLDYGDQYITALTPGDPQRSNGARFNVWTFQSLPGQCTRACMQATAFTPHLELRRDSSTGPLVVEGDGEVSRVLQDDSLYYVIATSGESGSRVGQYILSLNRC